MTSVLPPAEQIQQEMRQMRTELGDDVQEIVTSARDMTDWQYYVRRHPWFCLGAAALTGYLLVPTQWKIIRPDTESLLELAKENKLLINVENPTVKRGGILSGLASAVVATVAQGGLAILSQQLNQLLAANAQAAKPRSGETP